LLPQEVEQALRKLSKKGSTTRSKGFQELLCALKGLDDAHLLEMVKSGSMNGIFAKIFNKYLLSAERSSRASVAELTTFFVSKADTKLFFQPILKNIITNWIMGLFDPVAEIGASFRESLESVFPAGGKLKMLLERYDSTIWTEISEYASNPSKFAVLKEVIISEMDGTVEEANSAVELVKTEMLGVIDLCNWSACFAGDKIKPLFFLNDSSEMSGHRRNLIYRLALKINEPWLMKSVILLLSKETSPSAFPGVMDLLERTDKEELVHVLEKESFILAFLSNAPVKEFGRFSRLLQLKMMISKTGRRIICDCFVSICLGNTIMNKDRFICFFRELVGPVFNSSPEKSSLLERLLFRPSKRTNSALTAFSPLSAHESVQCLASAFFEDDLISVCLGKNDLQAAFLISFLAEKSESARNELENILKKLSISELQNRDLLSIVPDDLLTDRLSCDALDGESLSPSELLRLIQSLPTSRAKDFLGKQKSTDWERIMKCSFLDRNTIINIFFENESFCEFCQSHLDNLMIVECALSSETKVFFDLLPPLAVLEEALSNVKTFKLTSPLLLESLKVHELMAHHKIVNLSDSDRMILFSHLELERDVELFVSLKCTFEEFFPLIHVQEALSNSKYPCNNHIEILLFKSHDSQADVLMRELCSFPLTKFANQKVVSVAAVVFGVPDLVNFRISQENFDSAIDCSDFELFCMSKFVEFYSVPLEEVVPVESSSFKSVLKFYYQMRGMDNAIGLNSILDSKIFGDCKRDIVFLAETLCIEQVLPIRSDNLSGLISELKEFENVLLLLTSLHVSRDDLKKEFWRVQFLEVYSSILIWNDEDSSILKELKLRTAAGLWNHLENPEVELLKNCKFEGLLFNYEKELEKGKVRQFWDSIGLPKLILVTAPFTNDLFTVGGIREYFARNEASSTDLAIRGVYLQLHMDEKLVASSIALQSESCADASIEEVGGIIFPFYRFLEEHFHSQDRDMKRFSVLLEMFISAAEGSREDLRLLSAFGDVFKGRILGIICDFMQRNSWYPWRSLEEFNFIPRYFESFELFQHCLYRLCAIFPLLVGQNISEAKEICFDARVSLFKREMERIRRQPRISFESIEIVLKPVITSTTRIVNLRVNFAGEIDLSIDLLIPAAFPLESVRVEGKHKSGLAESKWKSALLTLQTLLLASTFSGNLVEVVKRWQANALKLFQGLEECAVCYCVLHPSDKSLPGPACKQCKHKFHATCLYKWFKSSGNATCPLCRALF